MSPFNFTDTPKEVQTALVSMYHQLGSRACRHAAWRFLAAGKSARQRRRCARIVRATRHVAGMKENCSNGQEANRMLDPATIIDFIFSALAQLSAQYPEVA